MTDTRLFGPEGKITKRIKRISTNTKSQKAAVEKQRKAQKKKTFVPGTQNQRPVSTDKGPNMNQINRPSQAEQYKNKAQPKVSKVKTKDYSVNQNIGPVYDSKPSNTTKINDTTEVKQHSVPKDTEKDLNKAKDKGMSNARKAFKMAQGLLKRPTSR